MPQLEENEVILSDYEVFIGAIVGVRRRIKSMKSPSNNRIQNKDFGWHSDIEAACGEIAFAKRFGHYYNFSVGTFKKPDVAGHQVRHTQHLNGCLFHYPTDNPDEKYALVVGQSAESFFVCGWLFGHEARQKEFESVNEHGYKSWKVQQQFLRPFEFPARTEA
jgi:hypothetical protein